MDAHILSLLCDPETHEALEFQPDALVNVRSGKRYPFRDGIPDFLDKFPAKMKSTKGSTTESRCSTICRRRCTAGSNASRIFEELSPMSWKFVPAHASSKSPLARAQTSAIYCPASRSLVWTCLGDASAMPQESAEMEPHCRTISWGSGASPV